jgi:hypothetical protein
VRVSELAYKKIIYHLMRYPTSKVAGALVGSNREVLDAYPLFHSPILNPALSVALDLIDSNLDPSLRIIGLYEFVEGSEPKINSIIENNQNLKELIPARVPRCLLRST